MSRTVEDRLVTAARDGDIEVMEQLLLNGTAIQTEVNHALGLAAQYGHLVPVALLLMSGADVHANDGWALQLAAYNGHTDVVELLLKYGADVHAGNDYALRAAAKYGHLDVVDVLLKSGSDLCALHDSEIFIKSIATIIKKYACISYRGIEAVMLLADRRRVDVLRHLHPELKPKQIREELAMLEALGLDAAQRATIWTSRHGVAPATPEIGVSA